MRLLDCEHPKKVYNKYLKEWVTVSCGTCPSCLRSRANKWIERLNVERKCWKYNVFFTLTFSPEHRPTLSHFGDYLVDRKHVHQSDTEDSPMINLNDYKEDSRTFDLMSAYNNTCPYLSVYDAQLFIKRLRKNLQNVIKKNYSDYDENDYKIRYYLVGEYGSTTYLPHYHGLLFFSSEKQATHIEEVIRKSWKFGVTDSSFVSGCNAGYVAKYLNCSSDLPRVLTNKAIRPFAIFSKFPAIGTLYFKDEKVQEIFFNASPTTIVDYFKGPSLRYAPIWRTIKDRLFPKISGYSRFFFADRVKLYRAAGYLESLSCFDWSCADFVDHMFYCYTSVRLSMRTKNPYFSETFLQLYYDYINMLQSQASDQQHLFESIARWYRVSHRVCTQAAAFGISVDRYLQVLDLFYCNCDKENLRMMYDYQSSFNDEYSDVSSLVGMDILFLEDCIDSDPKLLSNLTLTQLESYGIDIQKFTSEDLSIRQPYIDSLLPKNHREYHKMQIDSASWLKKATKTKVKNDTLRLRPEFIKLHQSI